MKKWISLIVGALLGMALGRLASVSPAHACDCDFEEYWLLEPRSVEGDQDQVDFWMGSPAVSGVLSSSGLYVDKGNQSVRLGLDEQ